MKKEENTLVSMRAVNDVLLEAGKHGLQVEVVTFALKAMKNDPNLKVSEAIYLGLGEWVK